jgi:hypothetical protein
VNSLLDGLAAKVKNDGNNQQPTTNNQQPTTNSRPQGKSQARQSARKISSSFC